MKYHITFFKVFTRCFCMVFANFIVDLKKSDPLFYLQVDPNTDYLCRSINFNNTCIYMAV